MEKINIQIKIELDLDDNLNEVYSYENIDEENNNSKDEELFIKKIFEESKNILNSFKIEFEDILINRNPLNLNTYISLKNNYDLFLENEKLNYLSEDHFDYLNNFYFCDIDSYMLEYEKRFFL